MANLKKWIVPTVVVVLAIKLPWLLFKFQVLTQTRSIEEKDKQMYYFYNEVTGEVQFEDPGNVPFEVCAYTTLFMQLVFHILSLS